MSGGNGFKLRSGVDDLAVWQNVVVGNEYRLPPTIHPEAVIVDIGAHIGCFAMAAYQRGARRIFCYEADSENYFQLIENVELLDHKSQVFTYNVAVWRSDLELCWNHLKLPFTDSELSNVGGGGNVLLNRSDAKKWSRVLPFDTAIDQATANGKSRVFIAKFDCEGSEWPILLTSSRLNMIDWIVGEYHEIGGPNMKYVREDQVHPTEIPMGAEVPGWSEYTAEGLKDFLEQEGFHTIVQPSPRLPWLGKFLAIRT